MVKFGADNVKEAMRLGSEAAIKVSKKFISPIKLEFEKVSVDAQRGPRSLAHTHSRTRTHVNDACRESVGCRNEH